MVPERERVKALLTEAVTLLCKNSVTHQMEVEVEGLLGITVDKNDVFLVNLHEIIHKEGVSQAHGGFVPGPPQFTSTPSFANTPVPNKRKRRRKSNDSSNSASASATSNFPPPPPKLTPAPNSQQKPKPVQQQKQQPAQEATIVLADDDDDNANGPNENSSQGAKHNSDVMDKGDESAAMDTSHDDAINDPRNNTTENDPRPEVDDVVDDVDEEDSTMSSMTGDNTLGVKREKDSYDDENSGFEGFEEPKWSALMDGGAGEGAGPSGGGGVGTGSFSGSPSTQDVEGYGLAGLVGAPGFADFWAGGGDESESEAEDEESRPKLGNPPEESRPKRGNPPEESRPKLGNPSVDAVIEETRARRTHQSMATPQECPMCKVQLPTLDDVTTHQLETDHLGSKTCVVCAKSFTTVNVLKRHIRTVHKGTLYVCKFCHPPATEGESSHPANEGESKWKVSGRIAKFTRRDNLRQHQLKAHGFVACDDCDETFVGFRELKKHEGMMHRQRESAKKADGKRARGKYEK